MKDPSESYRLTPEQLAYTRRVISDFMPHVCDIYGGGKLVLANVRCLVKENTDLYIVQANRTGRLFTDGQWIMICGAHEPIVAGEVDEVRWERYQLKIDQIDVRQNENEFYRTLQLSFIDLIEEVDHGLLVCSTGFVLYGDGSRIRI